VDQQDVEAVDQQDVEATVLHIQAVSAHFLSVVVSVVVERIVKSARLRPADGTERETAALAYMTAQPLSALSAVPKSHHLDQEERIANRNRQSLQDPTIAGSRSMVVPTR
jgi:hypothetical protein